MTRLTIFFSLGFVASAAAAADRIQLRPAFNGKCMVNIRAQKGQAGKIELTAKAEGLRSSKLVVRATAN